MSDNQMLIHSIVGLFLSVLCVILTIREIAKKTGTHTEKAEKALRAAMLEQDQRHREATMQLSKPMIELGKPSDEPKTEPVTEGSYRGNEPIAPVPYEIKKPLPALRKQDNAPADAAFDKERV